MQDETGTRAVHPPRRGKYGPSQVAELLAVRENEQGLFLDAETGNTNDDILLHNLQQTAPVKIGDRIRVFLSIQSGGSRQVCGRRAWRRGRLHGCASSM